MNAHLILCWISMFLIFGMGIHDGWHFEPKLCATILIALSVMFSGIMIGAFSHVAWTFIEDIAKYLSR